MLYNVTETHVYTCFNPKTLKLICMKFELNYGNHGFGLRHKSRLPQVEKIKSARSCNYFNDNLKRNSKVLKIFNLVIAN